MLRTVHIILAIATNSVACSWPLDQGQGVAYYLKIAGVTIRASARCVRPQQRAPPQCCSPAQPTTWGHVARGPIRCPASPQLQFLAILAILDQNMRIYMRNRRCQRWAKDNTGSYILLNIKLKERYVNNTSVSGTKHRSDVLDVTTVSTGINTAVPRKNKEQNQIIMLWLLRAVGPQQ